MSDYDQAEPSSIERYSQRLIGKTFAEVLADEFISKSDSIEQAIEKAKALYTLSFSHLQNLHII